MMFAEGWVTMKRMTLAAMGALALAGCGSTDTGREQASGAEDAVTGGETLGSLIDTAVDEKAVEQLVRNSVDGALREAAREVLPAQEAAVIGAIVDEDAVARKLGETVGGKAGQDAAHVMKEALGGSEPLQ